MLKKWTIAAASLLVVGGVILGPRSVWTSLRGARDQLQTEIEDAKSDVQRAAEVRVGLTDLDERISRFAEQLGSLEGRAQAARRGVQDHEQELERQKQFLARAKEVLDSGAEPHAIGGRMYTRAEVTADAQARLVRCEQLVRQLEFDRSLAQQLTDAVAEARTNLAQAHQVRLEKATQLTALEARLQNARLLDQVNELTRDLKAGPLGPQTELGQMFEAFERRVHAVEQRTRNSEAETRGGIVHWENDAATPSVSDAIGRFLDRSK